MTVAAITAVLGGQKVLRRKVGADSDLRAMTRAGLPAGTLAALAKELDVDKKVLATLVGVSERTLSRRLASGARLSMKESDRTMRVARVLAKTKDTFGNPVKAVHWLKTPNRVMEGQTPLSLLDTDAGVNWVETILGRIDYGLYS
jgi:putative toxin-antitoxin system antitoxin component (TIGR02293 family)